MTEKKEEKKKKKKDWSCSILVVGLCIVYVDLQIRVSQFQSCILPRPLSVPFLFCASDKWARLILPHIMYCVHELANVVSFK